MVVRAALRFGFGTASVLAGSWVLRALHGAPAALGATPAEIQAVAHRSPNYQDGVFVNIDPASGISLDREEQRQIIWDLTGSRDTARPPGPIPLATSASAEAAAARLAVNWCSPHGDDRDRRLPRACRPGAESPVLAMHTVGPQRMHEVPVLLEALPAVDAVLISHDHYDHLDTATIIGLARTQRAPFVVPLGVGAHLRKWGIPEDRIVELDWNESHRIAELTLVCTPARHFSGRLLSRNTTLWASWVIAGPRHRAFFGGDTGYTKSFAEIGMDHGPFDLTLLPIGAYHPAWPDIHMNPEEAVRAHLDVAEADSGLLVPIHWATFRLGAASVGGPVERLLRAADPAGVRVVVPGGRRVDPDTAPTFDPWWQL
jgi:L-ascorbate metabolism protein UlaG (beta-lactamase superfamily)